MPMSTYLFNCTRREAYFCYERRRAAGASEVSSPADQKRDWAAGEKEAIRKVGLTDLCLRLMNCTDIDDKIRSAVMYFVAEATGLSADEVDGQTPLPSEVEEKMAICCKASIAATNYHFALRRGNQICTIDDLIAAIQAAWQRRNRGV